MRKWSKNWLFILLICIVVVRIIAMWIKSDIEDKAFDAPYQEGKGILEDISPGKKKKSKGYQLTIFIPELNKRTSHWIYDSKEASHYKRGDSLLFDYKLVKPAFLLADRVYLYDVVEYTIKKSKTMIVRPIIYNNRDTIFYEPVEVYRKWKRFDRK